MNKQLRGQPAGLFNQLTDLPMDRNGKHRVQQAPAQGSYQPVARSLSTVKN
jgi:hypothetical protein